MSYFSGSENDQEHDPLADSLRSGEEGPAWRRFEEEPPPLARQEDRQDGEGSLPSSEVPCWVDPDNDTADWLYFHKLYNSGDPFESLTSVWLETGAKGLLDPGDEDEEGGGESKDKEPKPDPDAELKAELIRIQLEASKGHVIWMQGRELRAELVDQVEKRKMQPQDSINFSSSASYNSGASGRRMGASQSLDSAAGLQWYVAPRLPRTAKNAGFSAGKRKRTWCWRSDFVDNALHAAVAMGMEYPVVDAVTASKAVKKNPEVAVALRNHSAVVCTNRTCQLWSPSFLQSLGVLRNIWDYGTEVRLDEVELMANHPEAMKLFIGMRRPTEHAPTEVRMPVPKELLAARRRPPPVSVPERLPTRMSYKDASAMRGYRRQGSTASSLPGLRHSASVTSSVSLSAGFGVAGRMAVQHSGGGGRPGLHRSASGISASTRSRSSSKRVSFVADV